ncbi:hypothetical protein MMC30_000853 [Trapelia coarctata]|nr:hypothetical protein [Trapelia coarctata]
MSCLAKETWLAPDDEYSVSNEDYVFCCQRETTIKQYISSKSQEHGLSELDYAERGPRWLWGGKLLDGAHVGAGVLTFADVHVEDAFDVQRIREAQAKLKPLRELPTDVKEAEQRLIEHYRARESMKTDNRQTSHDATQHSSTIKPLTDSELLRNVIRHGGYLSWDIIDLVIRQESPKVKEAMLTVLSGQSYMQNPRPVMLFLGGIRDILSSQQKSNIGVVCAYDFMKDAIIIKAYDGGSLEHPLARSWYHSDMEGGFFLSRSPKEFLEALVVSKHDGVFFRCGRPNAGDIRRWLNIIAASLVGGWLQLHGEALGVPYTTLQPLSCMLGLSKIDSKFTELPIYAANKTHVTQELGRISTELRRRADSSSHSANEDGVLTDDADLDERFGELLPHLVQVLKDSERPLE